MHTQTLYTYALVALASSLLAAPVETSASASVSQNLVAREPFVVYGKSLEEEEDGGAAFGTERVRRVDGFALPVSKITVISRGSEGASGSPPGGSSSGANNGNGNGNGNGNKPPGPPPSNGSSNNGGPPPGSPPSSNGPGNSGSNGPSSGSSSGGLNGPSNGGPSGGSGGNQY
ncbi:uncharacterized protein EAE97_011126 [Botrytis byssoidea]|uniref:Uncharacterized protein n=1 Tax=Botrytis byssoidea TaxID=139641 RepID=A0A9P5HTK2_9HELO|nr:uncharacterized protein EAE97_011126 [Botrytis byssoidea]KAF7922384.1 hypothetical protein EAE97_011126 [Botrytis byssoidea]